MVYSLVSLEKPVCKGCGCEFTRKRKVQEYHSRQCQHKSTRHDKRNREARQSPTSFVGVDGEGITLPDGTHKYVLFGVGSDQIEDPRGLHWSRVLEFLYDSFRSQPKSAFVGFYLGYDFTQILRTLPERKAWELLSPDGQAHRRRISKTPKMVLPVQCDGWEIDIIPGKRLKIRPHDCHPDEYCKCKREPWMYICDAGSFWQTSFLNAMNPKKWQNPIITDEEYETIRVGKEARSTAALDDSMRFYNRLENEILARAMAEIDRGFRRIGIRLSRMQWMGPGQAAQRWMSNQGVITRTEAREIIPGWALDAALASFYAGWFEIPIHGIIRGVTDSYDLNSAYPHIIRSLPCLRHGRYSRGIANCPTDLGYVLVRATVRGSNDYLGVASHRKPDNGIFRPLASRGWFWLSELDASRRAGLVDSVDIHEWIAYEPCDCPAPMREVAHLYDLRLDVGKDSVLGKSSKLMYNSVAGKCQQSVGSPKFGNWIYASLITSGCRKMILDAIASHPEGARHVAMVATDGIVFLSPHPGLPVSNRLGEWSHSQHRNLTLFKPGVYWDDDARDALWDGKAPAFKARGINARAFADEIWRVDSLFQTWTPADNPGTDGIVSRKWPSVSYTSGFAMVSGTQALARGKWSTAGRVSDANHTEDSWPGGKRHPRVYYDELDRVYRSRPTTGQLDSIPYTPASNPEDDPFSYGNQLRFGENPDGPVAMQFKFINRAMTGE